MDPANDRRGWRARCAPVLLALLSLWNHACGGQPQCGSRCDRGAGESGGAGAAGARAGVGGSGGAGSAGAQPAPAIPAGACRPDGPSASALGTARSVVYSGPRELGALAVRRSTLYAADAAEGIFRIEEGGTPERVVEARVADMLVADLNLYYAENGALWRASLSATDDMPDRVVAVQSPAAKLFAFDESRLYFADGERGLFSVPIAGGMLAPLAAGSMIADAKLRAGVLYYADRAAGHLFALQVASGEREQLTRSALRALAAVEASSVAAYFSADHVLHSAALETPGAPEAIAVSGLAAAGNPGPIRRLLLRDERVYFSDDGSIGWVEARGGECALVVKDLPAIYGWDVAGAAVYVATAGAAPGTRELWRIARE